MLLHEFGHSLDSHRYGSLYLFEIGCFPSLNSSRNTRDVPGTDFDTHDVKWMELRANKFALRCMRKHYGWRDEDWSRSYPTDF